MKIAAIIPAFNEAKTIGAIVSVLTRVNIIDTVTVVSDGSIDKTAEVSLRYGATVIELPKNKGKGAAMKAGLDSTEADIILFLDADLIGLTSGHVLSLLLPVMEGSAVMTVGIFNKGRLTTDLAQKVAPYLSGQRAIRRTVLEKIPDMEIARFGVEIALTQYIKSQKCKVKKIVLPDMSHVMKEEKLGIVKGFAARVKMYWEIIRYFTRAEQLK